MQRESMEVDVVIVGAGPAGLATACKLLQLAQAGERGLTVCVLEKGSEIGAHILSGAVFEPSALTELFPDWKERGAPLQTAVTKDAIYYLGGSESSFKFPGSLVPRTMDNHGNYIISLGNLCAWLGEQAMELGAEVFPGLLQLKSSTMKTEASKGLPRAIWESLPTVSRKRPSSPGLNSTPNTPFLPKVAGASG